MGFRNSSQNRNAVKIERDSRSHTKFNNTKSTHTMFKMFGCGKKSEKSRKKVENWFSKTRIRIEKQSNVSEIAAPTLNIG